MYIDCTGPAPNYAAKLARDDVLAKRERDTRNADRKARRLSSAATTAAVSDDEMDYDDYEATHAKLQALLEPTKS